MPEVQLGLLPGAGGTQRLPKLVSYLSFLSMVSLNLVLAPLKKWNGRDVVFMLRIIILFVILLEALHTYFHCNFRLWSEHLGSSELYVPVSGLPDGQCFSPVGFLLVLQCCRCSSLKLCINNNSMLKTSIYCCCFGDVLKRWKKQIGSGIQRYHLSIHYLKFDCS